MQKIYAIIVSGKYQKDLFFGLQKDAIKALKQIKNDIKSRNVNVVTDTDERFEFYFGWEEHGATYQIVDIDLR